MSENAEKSPCVLMIDDDGSTRLWAETYLEDAGFNFIEAADGVEGLVMLREHNPDLVLLDVDMPRLDGFATCEQIRSEPRFADVPIIMITGMDDTESVEWAYAVGATDFSTKPINWPLLIHRLRYTLRAHDALKSQAEAAQEVAETSRALDEAQRLADMGSWEWNISTGQMTWSSGLFQLLGIDVRVPPSPQALLDSFVAEERLTVKHIIDRVAGGVARVSRLQRIVRGDGQVRTVQHRIASAAVDLGGERRVRATLQDVTESQAREARIHELAYFDSLTGLPNRALFRERLGKEVQRAQTQGKQLAMLFVDLDDFKRINDTLGHRAGDQLLIEAAKRLLRCSSGLAAADSRGERRAELGSNVARLGGDEFTVLLTDLQSREEAVALSERIVEALGEPVDVGGHDIFSTPSIGIALFPSDGKDADELLKNADTAMYFSKRDGKNQHRFFSEEMNADSMRRMELEFRLRQALKNNELQVHYQPQMDLREGTFESVEALLRWTDEKLGEVTPAELIPIAEQTGLIVPIGCWVLKTACAQLKAWQSAGIGVQRVAVNVSLRQFALEDFPSQVKKVLDEVGLAAASLELEITETVLSSDVQGAIDTLAALKALGVKLSIDDFGTGYSSLTHLKRFPVDHLKIDRSFVGDLTGDQDDAAITLAVIGMAEAMDLKVVAEGVETLDQLDFLRQHHCDKVQGFYLSYPLPARQIADLFKQVSEVDESPEQRKARLAQMASAG